MAHELSTLSPIPTQPRSDPRPQRQPRASCLAQPRAEALLREMAFVLKATRAVRESMSAG